MDVFERAEELARSAAGNTIRAHGQTWTVAQARARIHQLTRINEDPEGPGPSDGRITEINSLESALAARYEAYNDTYERAFRDLQIKEWTRELAQLGTPDVECERTICFIEPRYRTRRKYHYTTEQGFLRALIRIRGNGGEIVWAE